MCRSSDIDEPDSGDVMELAKVLDLTNSKEVEAVHDSANLSPFDVNFSTSFGIDVRVLGRIASSPDRIKMVLLTTALIEYCKSNLSSPSLALNQPEVLLPYIVFQV